MAFDRAPSTNSSGTQATAEQQSAVHSVSNSLVSEKPFTRFLASADLSDTELAATIRNRGLWLNRLKTETASWFEEKGYPLPPCRLSVGFPSRGRKRVMGQCWTDSLSADGHHEIFINPIVDDSLFAAEIVLHELIHAAVGIAAGHRGPFAKLATALGLVGPMTSTRAGNECRRRLAVVLEKIGPIPHGALRHDGVGGDPEPRLSTAPKPQQARQMKVFCPDCGYIARVSRMWLRSSGAPLCPTHQRQMKEC